MSDILILSSLRAMAWERAKGEMEAALETFYGDGERFDAADAAIREFIKKVEDNGLLD